MITYFLCVNPFMCSVVGVCTKHVHNMYKYVTVHNIHGVVMGYIYHIYASSMYACVYIYICTYYTA